jgi:hypothetical protein
MQFNILSFSNFIFINFILNNQILDLYIYIYLNLRNFMVNDKLNIFSQVKNINLIKKYNYIKNIIWNIFSLMNNLKKYLLMLLFISIYLIFINIYLIFQ